MRAERRYRGLALWVVVALAALAIVGGGILSGRALGASIGTGINAHVSTPNDTPTPCVSGWLAGPPIPPGGVVRSAGVWFPGNGRFYSIGGRSAASRSSGLLYPFEFNPSTGTWRQMNASLASHAIDNMVAAVLTTSVGARIFVVGGNDWFSNATADVRIFDPISDTITLLTTDPWPGFAVPGGFAVYGNKLYILGGFDPASSSGTNEIWELDPNRPAGSRWTLKNAHLPQRLAFVPAATIGDFIYTAGGMLDVFHQYSPTTATYRYDPVADVIDDAAIPDLLPPGTTNTRALSRDGQIWVMGGGASSLNPGNRVWVWQPGDPSWSIGSTFITGRRNFAVDQRPGGEIYLVGGYAPSAPVGSMEIYHPPAGECATTTPSSTPTITLTGTVTHTRTSTPTRTSTRTRTTTQTITSTATPTDTPTPSNTGTPGSATPTLTVTTTQIPCVAHSWSIVASPNIGDGRNGLWSVSAVSPYDVWAVGSPGSPGILIEHWDGARWSIVPSPASGLNGTLFAVAAVSANDVWIAGNYYVSNNTWNTLALHWNGIQWSIVASPNDQGQRYNELNSLTVVSTSDVWAVGYSGISSASFSRSLTLHWDGTTWTIIPSITLSQYTQLHSVSAVSSNDVWAMGFSPDPQNRIRKITLTEHWNGTEWSVVPSPNPPDPNLTEHYIMSATALGPNDVWAVGYSSSSTRAVAFTMHWDGSEWSLVRTPDFGDTFSALYGVAGLSSDEMWAVGNLGTRPLALHWDGVSWDVSKAPQPSASFSRFFGVGAAPPYDLFAVGEFINENNLYRTLTERFTYACVPSPTRTSTRTITPTPTPTPTITNTPTNTRVGGDAFMVFVPGEQGNCPAPENEGTTTTGCRFILDMMLDSGSIHDVTAEDGYLTYTYRLIQNAEVSSIRTECVLTTTVTGDFTIFDADLQNEICNGPDPCVFRNRSIQPGSFAYSAGALLNCPDGCDGYFRIAQVGLCAVARGRAVLHWQFSPPDPRTRDTVIVNNAGYLVHDPALFRDYVIHVVAPTPTPCGLNFTDVHPEDYFYTPVQYLACETVISGYGDYTFRPYNNTTRGQMCKIVALAEGWQINCPQLGHFSDVPPSDPFYCYVETAFAHGIISGYADGTFRPFNNVTRAQTCKIVTLARGWAPLCPAQPHFTDVLPTDPFYCFVETAYDQDVITGYADGTFRPYSDVIRGQLSKMVYSAVYSP